MNNLTSFLEKLGKALILPLALLPIAAVMLGVGQPGFLNLPFFAAAGDAFFSNLPLLLAIGIAVGFAGDGNGAAGLAGAIGFFVLNGTASATFTWITGNFAGLASVYEGVSKIDTTYFGGVIAGIVAGFAYNKYKSAKLPDWLGFFGGRRFVPIMTSFFTFITGFIFGFIWPFVQRLLDSFGNAV